MFKKEEQYEELRSGVLPLDEVTGLPVCPPPKEILSVRLERIYNECKQTAVNEIPIAIVPPVKANEVQCVGAKVENIRCEAADEQVTVTFDLSVTFKLLHGNRVVTTITEKILNETKTVGLGRAGEPGLNCEVDIYPECLLCFITCSSSSGFVSEVTCCVGKLFVFRLVAPVQVLLPAFGFCPEPPECGVVAGVCPDYRPKWPPYPPAPTEPCVGNNKGGCHCG